MTRARVGRRGWAVALTVCVLVAVVSIEDPSMARAQDSAADSTATAPVFPFADSVDSTAVHPGPGSGTTSADSDSLAIEALRASLNSVPGFVWLSFLGSGDNQRPSIRGGYDSERARYGGTLDFKLPISALGGFSSTTSYYRDLYRETATEQEKTNRNFSTDWKREMSTWGQFDLGFQHRESTTETVNAEPSKTDDSNLSSSLSGRGVLGQSRIDGKWSLRGTITDKTTSSSLIAGSTKQQLSKGTASGGLGRKFGAWGLSVNAGLDASAGPQALSSAADGSDVQEDTKTTLSDTLGVNIRWQGGERRSFTAKLTRTALTEERLDFLRDTRGVTLIDPDTNQKIVGNEREVRDVVRVDLSAEDRLFRSFRYALRYGIERRETQYELNLQNFVPEQSQNFGGDAWYRFAAAGSLKVSVNFVERWDDRLLQGSENFRGKDYNNTNSLTMILDQRVFSTSSFRLLYAEDLTQQIFEYKLSQGTQDVDVLARRFEGKLSSKPFGPLSFTALGSYRTSANINLDADRVAANNRDQDNWKVTMDYKLQLSPTVSFGQGYQLSIDYTDYHYSFLEDESQRDKFYKRTQMRSELNLNFREGTRFNVSHTIDRTRGGTKEIFFGIEESAYTDDASRRQDEHRLSAGITVPIWGYSLDVGTNRTLRQTRGVNEEQLGDFRIQLSGQSRFLSDHLVLGLRIGHVWAYGPPRLIRTERDKSYFTSASHLTWIF